MPKKTTEEITIGYELEFEKGILIAVTSSLGKVSLGDTVTSKTGLKGEVKKIYEPHRYHGDCIVSVLWKGNKIPSFVGFKYLVFETHTTSPSKV